MAPPIGAMNMGGPVFPAQNMMSMPPTFSNAPPMNSGFIPPASPASSSSNAPSFSELNNILKKGT